MAPNHHDGLGDNPKEYLTDVEETVEFEDDDVPIVSDDEDDCDEDGCNEDDEDDYTVDGDVAVVSDDEDDCDEDGCNEDDDTMDAQVPDEGTPDEGGGALVQVEETPNEETPNEGGGTLVQVEETPNEGGGALVQVEETPNVQVQNPITANGGGDWDNWPGFQVEYDNYNEGPDFQVLPKFPDRNPPTCGNACRVLNLHDLKNLDVSSKDLQVPRNPVEHAMKCCEHVEKQWNLGCSKLRLVIQEKLKKRGCPAIVIGPGDEVPEFASVENLIVADGQNDLKYRLIQRKKKRKTSHKK